jgi:excisionase family DNA binding protein
MVQVHVPVKGVGVRVSPGPLIASYRFVLQFANDFAIMEGMNTMSAIRGLLTVYETAERLEVSHAQVTRYVKQGLLPAKRIGQTILIDEADVDQFERPKRGNPNFREKVR